MQTEWRLCQDRVEIVQLHPPLRILYTVQVAAGSLHAIRTDRRAPAAPDGPFAFNGNGETVPPEVTRALVRAANLYSTLCSQ